MQENLRVYVIKLGRSLRQASRTRTLPWQLSTSCFQSESKNCAIARGIRGPRAGLNPSVSHNLLDSELLTVGAPVLVQWVTPTTTQIVHPARLENSTQVLILTLTVRPIVLLAILALVLPTVFCQQIFRYFHMISMRL